MSKVMGELQKRLLRLLENPRVAELLRDQRVQQTVMRGLRFRGRVQGIIDQRLDRVAGLLNFATKREIRELKRAIRRLEEQLRDTEKHP